MLRLVCISDTHGHTPEIRDGDVLVHAGDISSRGTQQEVVEALHWMKSLPHKIKILTPGNHDFFFEQFPEESRELCKVNGIILLMDELYTHPSGLRFWGSPWQPWFYDWAFNLQRGPEIRAKWDLIPEGVDVLITHGPPYGILDTTPAGEAVGCSDLRDTILQRVKPEYHVFGHIHDSHGIVGLPYCKTTFINASLCDESYDCSNTSVTIDIIE